MSFVCYKCNQAFVKQYDLILHRDEHKDNKTINEDEEVLNFIEVYVYQYDGMDCHYKRKEFRCVKCNREFLYKNCCISHIQTNERNAKCTLCDKVFTCKKYLKEHLQIHTHETPYQCGICSKPFLRKDKLIEHAKTHKKDKTISRAKKRCKELKENVSPLQSVFKCKSCSKQYTRQQHLDLHQLSHSNGSPYVCEFCEQGFLRSDHLKNHQNIHKYDWVTNECLCAVYGASLCKELLKPHMIAYHPDILKFKCDTCGKAFKSKGNLIYHKRCHLREKN